MFKKNIEVSCLMVLLNVFYKNDGRVIGLSKKKRKKKSTRKYEPRNEFRYNNSPRAGGHPHFVFGETKTHYKSLVLTSHPKDDIV